MEMMTVKFLTLKENFHQYNYWNDNLIFVDNPELFDIISYIDLEYIEEIVDSFVVSNPNALSQIYFSNNWDAGSGCFTSEFTTELSSLNIIHYHLKNILMMECRVIGVIILNGHLVKH